MIVVESVFVFQENIIYKVNGFTTNLMVTCNLFMGVGKIVYMWLKYSLT